MSVIGYLDKLETAFFDRELDLGRAGVERVFDQFFDSV